MDFKTPIEMLRATHYGNNYFVVYSHKLKRNVQLFSNFEYYNFLTLEVDPNVEIFCEQPYKIDIIVDGELKHAIFDVWVKYKDGTEEFQEVKYKSELEGSDKASMRSQEQIRRQQHWCDDNHIRFVVKTEEDVIRGRFWLQNLNVVVARIRRYLPLEDAYYTPLIMNALEKNELTLSELRNMNLLPINYELEHVCSLYCRGLVDMDLADKVLDNRMVIRRAEKR